MLGSCSSVEGSSYGPPGVTDNSIPLPAEQCTLRADKSASLQLPQVPTN